MMTFRINIIVLKLIKSVTTYSSYTKVPLLVVYSDEVWQAKCYYQKFEYIVWAGMSPK